MVKSKEKKISVNSHNGGKLSISNPDKVAEQILLEVGHGPQNNGEIKLKTIPGGNEGEEETEEHVRPTVEKQASKSVAGKATVRKKSKNQKDKSINPESSKTIPKASASVPSKEVTHEVAQAVPDSMPFSENAALPPSGEETLDDITKPLAGQENIEDSLPVLEASQLSETRPQNPKDTMCGGFKKSRSKRCVSIKKGPWVIYINSKNPHLKHVPADPNSTRRRGDSLVDSRVYSRIAFEIRGSRSSARNLADWEASKRAKSTNNFLAHSNTCIDPGYGCKTQSQEQNTSCSACTDEAVVEPCNNPTPTSQTPECTPCTDPKN